MDGKKYELVFEHPSGLVLSIATDDIYGLSEQPWFLKFFESAGLSERTQMPMQQQAAPMQTPQQRRVMQQDPYESANPFDQPRVPVPPQSMRPQQVPQPSFLEVHPNNMNVEIWGRMTEDQKQQWQQKWIKR